MTTVVESFCSDEEYNELEEQLDDAQEAGEAVQDGAEAAAQLLAELLLCHLLLRWRWRLAAAWVAAC